MKPARISGPWGAAVLLLTCLIGALAGRDAAAREMQGSTSPLGLWQTPGGGVIGIDWCGQVLCGRIVGIPRAPGEPMPKDIAGRSQCGLTIISQATEGQDSFWFGHITDPRNGRQYSVQLWVDDEDSLHVRGYVGVPLLGETQIWHRYNGGLGPECTIA
jgi:uncharacterized protein (DUF2147 family)